jgi:antitoxin VapB
MPLNIRDPRAAVLARDLARRRGTTMTEAIITALEAEIERERRREPLAARLGAIADDLAAQARAGGRRMTRDEIDASWGG